MRIEFHTILTDKVEVLWTVTLFCLVHRYQHFAGRSHLHLQGWREKGDNAIKWYMHFARKVLVGKAGSSVYWLRLQTKGKYAVPKRWELRTRLHGVSPKNTAWIIITMCVRKHFLHITLETAIICVILWRVTWWEWKQSASRRYSTPFMSQLSEIQVKKDEMCAVYTLQGIYSKEFQDRNVSILCS